MATDDRDDDRAGAGRFKKGKSGNPNGRPKKAKTVGAAILGALNGRVPVRENGRRRSMSKLEATALQFANKGASGDTRAGKLAFDLAQKAEERLAASAPPPAELRESDQEIVARIKARLLLVLKGEEDVTDHA